MTAPGGSRGRRPAPRLILLSGLLWLGGCGADETGEPGAADPATEQAVILEREIELLFPGADGFLHRERRTLPAAEAAQADARERVATIVRELLAGPAGEELSSALPAGTELSAVDLIGGAALIWLEPPVGQSRPSLGSREELLAVYALVNTVTAALPEIDSVGLLWQGTQPETLAGHVDTTRPLRPRPRWIAPSERDGAAGGE